MEYTAEILSALYGLRSDVSRLTALVESHARIASDLELRVRHLESRVARYSAIAGALSAIAVLGAQWLIALF